MKKWLVFFALSLAVFWLTFGPIGKTLSDLWSSLFIWWKPSGLIGALWTVATTLLGLLPQILILFSYFYFLENSGLDFPCEIIMGFGCTTVAASTTKNRRTAILLPFVPCSAKAPVVLLIAAVLRLNFFIIFLLYAICVLIGIIASRLVKSKRDSQIEKCSANYGGGLVKTVVLNTLQFFRRISGTVLVAATVLYFLKSYTFHLRIAETFNQSMLFWICDFFSIVFIPLGLGSAAVMAALAFGFLGKELVAATIALFADATLILSTASPFGFTRASLAAFLVFFMLYPPCISAIKATAAQTGARTATLSIFLNITTAYVAAFIVYSFAILAVV